MVKGQEIPQAYDVWIRKSEYIRFMEYYLVIKN